MRTTVIVSLSLIWLASAALAQSGPPSPQPKAPAASAQPSADGPASKKKMGQGDTVAKQPQAPDGKSGLTDALSTCLEIWDPATHMTRQEWARACRRVADRLKSTTVN
jgi:hypothetical protein